MEQNIYSVYDKLANQYGPLFGAPTDEVAIRNFFRMARENKLRTAEYGLYQVAKFDQETGNIEIDYKVLIAPIADGANPYILTGEENDG